MSETAVFRRGAEQFNAGRFFEAHETWEEIWLLAAEPERTFLQGMIQVAAGFHHYARGNSAGALSLLQAALEKLAQFPDDHRGIRLAAVRESARWWVNQLGRGERPGMDWLPHIRFVAEPD